MIVSVPCVQLSYCVLIDGWLPLSLGRRLACAQRHICKRKATPKNQRAGIAGNGGDRRMRDGRSTLFGDFLIHRAANIKTVADR